MHKKRLLLLLPAFFLTSCGGYSLSYLVKGNTYNSSVFQENYYTHWDDEFKNLETSSSRDVETFAFADLFKIDPITLDKYPTPSDYAADYKMNNVDDMFNYGVQSKLFDGQMVCGAQNGRPELAYQLARVQTEKDGFSVRFAKESDELSYFAMQFKASTDNTAEVYKVNSDELAKSDTDMYHNSSVDITISLYTKADDSINKNDFNFHVDIDNNRTNNGSAYTFVAFDLKEYHLSRLIGLSITYTFEDELINWNKTKGIDNIDYALFLYEMFLPHTNWH